MAFCFFAWILLAVCAIAAAQGDDLEIDRSPELLATISAMYDPVAIYSSISDPNRQCLTAKLETFAPRNRNATFIWTYPRADASFGDRVRCFEIIINMTESGNFPFRPCGEGQHFGVAQELYSDRETCFVGRFPPDDECLLFVSYFFRDSFPEECERQFDRLCGGNKYALHSGRYCNRLG
ncbi:uncharacterized protein LOC144149601 isoform X2 [Haemaphysalis longicornis]